MKDWLIKFNFKIENIDFKINELISNKISDTVGKSTTGDKATQYYIDPILANTCFSDLKNLLKDCLLKEKLIEADNEIEILHCWTVIGYENCFHKMHRHNDYKLSKDLSVVYYSAVSEVDTNKPGTFFAIINDEIIEYDPNIYDTLVFPVTVYHGTYPQGKGKRQTVNFDIRII